jgi:DNA polymerase-3 subunit gamma/tau
VDSDLTFDDAAQGGSHVALYRRWRAQTFSRIVGQDAVVTTLRNAVRTGQVAHALLFVGPRGTGKTSMARIVAKALNCTNLQDGDPCDTCPSCVAIRDGRTLDVVELDAATNNKVDQIRELVERTWTAPSDMRRKVFIIDEVQRITDGWDVLLKTLEEPPPHIVFIFCTTDPTRIRPAVLSRVQRFEFRRLTVPEIEGKLSTILAADGRAAEPEAISLVARQAAGGMRDAESMLDQLLSSSSGLLTLEAVRDLLGLVDAEVIDAFLAALLRGDALSGIDILDGLEAAGRDLGAFLDQVVVALRAALSAALSASSSADPRWPVGALTEAARRIVSIDASRAGTGGLRFQLELVLIESATSGAGTRTAIVSPVVSTQTVSIVPDPPRASAPAVVPARVAAAEVVPVPVAEPSATVPPPVAEPVVPVPALVAEPVAPDPPPAPVRTSDPGDETARPAAAGGPADEQLRELDKLWPSIVAELSKSPPIKPLIDVCRPIAVDGGSVTLGFPEGKAFLKDVAERRRSTLEEGIARALGRPVAVRLVATNLELMPPLGSADEDSEGIVEAARRIFADDLVDAGEVG